MTDPLFNHRVDALTTAVEKLTLTIEHFDERMASTYVRKDVYAAEQKASGEALEAVKGDVESHSKVIAWVAYTIIGVVLLALLGGVVVTSGALP